MRDEVDELIADCACGTATEAARSQVDADARARVLVEALEQTFQVVGLVRSAPRAPWEGISRELAGVRRFSHLIAPVADLFAFSLADAEALLALVDSQAHWFEGPSPGIWLLPVSAGARWEGFLTTLLRLEPNVQFPEHRHAAEERVLLLEGGYRDDQLGVEFWRGALDVRPAGSEHSFTALEGLGCLCASVTKLGD